VIGENPLSGHLFVFRSLPGRPIENLALGSRRLCAVVQAAGGKSRPRHIYAAFMPWQRL